MSPSPHEPAVAIRRLKGELRNARKVAGRTQTEVAAEMDWSTAKVIRIEGGAKISKNDLRALLEYYGVTEPERVELLHEMARVVREEDSSWSKYGDLLKPSSQRYLAYEAEAEIIRAHQAIVVPGLLQTEEYCAALMVDAYGAHPDDAERLWEARQRRQRVHERASPPELSFILDEAVVRRLVGGWRVMRRQLVALQEYAAMPHISIQILPFAAGAHPGLRGRFVHLEFSNPNDDDVLYLEEPDATTVREDHEETGRYLDRFFTLSAIALPAVQTAAFLDKVIAEMDGTVGPVPGRGEG